MFLPVLLIVLQGTPFPAFGIDLDRIRTLTAGLHPHLVGHIDVPGGKQAGIHVGVESPLCDHQFIHMVQAYMVEGLAFTDQRRDDVIQTFLFLVRDSKPLPCF